MDTIAVKDVVVGDRLRSLDEEKVSELVESIQEIGLLQRIAVTRSNQLIYGRHRLEAFKRLGIEQIPCEVKEVEGIRAELEEIDENLIRKELGPYDRPEHLKRRKEIYEELHPETKHGGDRKSNEFQGSTRAGRDLNSFAKDTSAKTGLSERTIQEDIQIATVLSPEVKQIARVVDLTRKDALSLVSITKKDPEKAETVARVIQEAPTLGVKEATQFINQVQIDEDTPLTIKISRSDEEPQKSELTPEIKERLDKYVERLATKPMRGEHLQMSLDHLGLRHHYDTKCPKCNQIGKLVLKWTCCNLTLEEAYDEAERLHQEQVKKNMEARK